MRYVALMTALDRPTTIPVEFSLSGVVQPDDRTRVTYETPQGSRLVGTYLTSDMTAALLPEVLGLKVPFYLGPILRGYHLPRAFQVRAYPEGSDIVFCFSVPATNSAQSFWSKRVSARNWNVSQMIDLLSWVQDVHRGGTQRT